MVGTFVKPKDSPLSWRENEFLTDHLDLIYPKKNKSVTGWNFLLKSTFEEKFFKYFSHPKNSPTGWSEFHYLKLNKKYRKNIYGGKYRSCWEHFCKVGIFENADFLFLSDSNLPKNFDITKFLKTKRYILHCLCIGLFDSLSSYLKSFDMLD